MNSATDRDPDELLDAVTLADDPPESVPDAAAAASPPGDSPTPADEGPPPSEPALSEADASAAPAAPVVTPPLDLTTYAPPAGGTPFTVSADGRKHPIEGALEYPTGVWIPKASWPRVQNNLIGDRSIWRQERAQLLSERDDALSAKSTKEARADAALAKVHALFSDPELLAKEYENWTVNGQRLIAEADKAALEAENQRLAQVIQEREDREEEAQLIPRMQDWVAEQVEESLKAGGPLAGLMERDEAARFVRELWDRHRAHFFREGPNKQQRVILLPEQMRELIEDRAAAIQRYRAGMQKVEQKIATNAAVLTPTKPGLAAPAKPVVPKVTEPARAEDGTFTKQDRKTQKRAARAMLDDLSLDDAMA